MKKITLLLIGVVFLTNGFAQESDTTKKWTSKGIFNLSASQVQLTNWAAGGENSFSTMGLLDYSLNYKEGKTYWDNNVKLTYGSQIIGDKDPVKTDDVFEFSSKYGVNTKADDWYYAALVTMKTQMTVGFEYAEDGTETKISDLFAPAYFVYSVGLDYKLENFSIYMSPITGKTTVVTAPLLYEQGVYGLEAGEQVLNELGGFIKIAYKKDIMKNVNLSTKLELFSSYTEHPENIDIAWDVLINMKINKYISASITANLIYDDDIDVTDKDGNTGPRIQFKDVLGIGFAYKF